MKILISGAEVPRGQAPGALCKPSGLWVFSEETPEGVSHLPPFPQNSEHHFFLWGTHFFFPPNLSFQSSKFPGRVTPYTHISLLPRKRGGYLMAPGWPRKVLGTWWGRGQANRGGGDTVTRTRPVSWTPHTGESTSHPQEARKRMGRVGQ